MALTYVQALKQLMKQLSTLIFLMGFVWNSHAQSAPHEQILDQLREAKVPAIGFGLIQDGELVVAKVLGELEEGRPAPDHTIFNVASLTKPIVAVLTLRLVSDGQWELDAPLANYWVDPDVADDPLHKELTTRHILSHQTGFKNWRRMYDDQKLAFEFAPGTKFQYSGEGYEYLRRALEKKFGQPLDVLADSLLFQPYDMTSSRLVWDTSMDDQPFAIGHNADLKPYETTKRTAANAADDLLTTVTDYGQFAIQLMKANGFSKSVYEEMLTPQVQANERIAFGLGWMIIPDLSDGSYALMHTGGDQGVRAITILFPESKNGVVLFTNGDNGVAVMRKVAASLSSMALEVLSALE